MPGIALSFILVCLKDTQKRVQFQYIIRNMS
nr:MAG TPA: hypothetical protein [Caudoviricetes sp.]